MSQRNSYFSYHAAGSAVGGIMTDPKLITVPTQAMASLSPSGGYGTATIENFCFDGLVYLRKGTTTVQGDLKQTELTVTLEDIKVADRLSVGRIVLHMVAHAEPKAYEANIIPVGSTIEDLRVDGKEISLKCYADTFARHPTWSNLQQAYKDHDLDGLIMAPGTLGERCSADRFDACETRAGNVRATLYPLDSQSSGLPVVNGGLRVKSFGTLYFGEYRITKFSRRLTMLRVELGCDRSGSMSFGDGSGNGQWEPPD